MAEVPVTKPFFTDWLIMRLFNRPEEETEVCILTTRGKILARHCRDDLRQGVRREDRSRWEKVPGLRRYRTEKMAKAKAHKLNRFFNTEGYSAIREDRV